MTTRTFAVGERLTLRLTLGGYGAPLSVAAEVRWLRPAEADARGQPAGVGVRFIAPRSGVAIRLARLLHLHGAR
jgi:Tfp pilus assembly protein PilZ